jgi:hypothetical protein
MGRCREVGEGASVLCIKSEALCVSRVMLAWSAITSQTAVRNG